MTFQFTAALQRLATQKPMHIASHCNGRERTWADLQARSARLASALINLGVQPGDRVAMLGLNSDYYLEYMLGVWWAGGALNPVNTRWSPTEMAYSLDDCQTRILLIDDEYKALAGEIHETCSTLQTLIYAGPGECPPLMLDYEHLLSENKPVAPVPRTDNELAGVFYTGGTTGFPKGVMLSHGNMIYNSLANSLAIGYNNDDVILSCAPLFHQAGMCIVTRALLQENKTVFVGGFEPVAVMSAIESQRATFTLIVPTMIQRLVDHPRLGEFDLSSMKRILYGASPISEGLLKRSIQSLPTVKFMQGYGMTETAGPFTILSADFHRPDMEGNPNLRSAGQALLGTDLRISDAEGNEAKPMVIGEIQCRSPGVMLGYWGKPEQTHQTLVDGWVHTGDAGYLNDEGLLFIVDRVKDMIVSGGENIYSAEVENAIGRHPAVASCAVIGIPDPEWGEAVHAVIVLHDGEQVEAQTIRNHCKTLIASYKCPRSIEFRCELPVNAAGKLQKFQLREPFWRDIDRNVS